MTLLDDPLTATSISRLIFRGIEDPTRLVLWVGAGASRWCGYPLWSEFAEQLLRTYRREKIELPEDQIRSQLESGKYPNIFETLKECNRQIFSREIIQTFSPREISPVFRRLISSLLRLENIQIITTNYDTLLERNIDRAQVITPENSTLAIEYFRSTNPWIFKIHGCINQFESMIVTSSDYEGLLNRGDFLHALTVILSQARILFVGYGLRDQYLIDRLDSIDALQSLIGGGPHFMPTTELQRKWPESVNPIHYSTDLHRDHRSQLVVLEEVIRSASTPDDHVAFPEATSNTPDHTSHLVYEVYPAGRWNTSQTVSLTSVESGKESEMVIGPGYADTEFPGLQPSALQDLLVGLICFDRLIVPLATVDRIHNLLGGGVFWRLVKDEAIQIVHWSSFESIQYPGTGSISDGTIERISIRDSDKTERTIGDILRQQLHPVLGLEKQAELDLKFLESKVILIPDDDEKATIRATRAMLFLPTVRKIIGMSEGTPLNSVPRWMAFPVLRVAQTVRIATACRTLGITSARLGFGSSVLAQTAFPAAYGVVNTSSVSSYIICGNFSSDIGRFAIENRSVIPAVVGFRNSTDGSRLRQEIGEMLMANEGSEISTTIEGGMRRMIPLEVLESSRRRFTDLLFPTGVLPSTSAVVWNDSENAQELILNWRRRSAEEFSRVLSDLSLSNYDRCPCGSGEKVRWCCEEALRSS